MKSSISQSMLHEWIYTKAVYNSLDEKKKLNMISEVGFPRGERGPRFVFCIHREQTKGHQMCLPER